ncbi:hypothetical protein AMEX_G22688 [Astyanax mexicanus]|uniref:Uncharacterized protein n=1 Tax=Astyanax mexicanus TaxID=7994 RepID=A0A8T2KY43_ASTMX|nr:hypothetical protein AMEX_G22688 [Astyanax mexicanus]
MWKSWQKTPPVSSLSPHTHTPCCLLSCERLQRRAPAVCSVSLCVASKPAVSFVKNPHLCSEDISVSFGVFF